MTHYNGFSQKQVDLAYSIGRFFYETMNKDREATIELIERLDIQDIKYYKTFREEYVEITLGRPGLLIGLKGERIEALNEYLGVTVKIIEAPTTWMSLIISDVPYPDDDDGYLDYLEDHD